MTKDEGQTPSTVADGGRSGWELTIAPEVRAALAAGRAVVALESTVIAHGLPYPQNREVALAMEAIIREQGAVPATIAVLGGALRVGLTASEIEHLATAPNVRKLSRRDIAACLAQRLDGATTVAATMLIAHRAGIRVFATGGIGGVHRQGISESANGRMGESANQQINEHATRTTRHVLDISADLPELARTPVCVVCAGAKAILDLPATLEWLETWGVPVLGYQTDEFPAFYSRSSGLPVTARVASPAEAAAVARAHWALGGGGLLLAVPVPAADELPPEAVERAIAEALAAAARQGISGPAVTPFLLQRVGELTGGASLRANVALLQNNAAVAARIALALS
jgi:pseudouridine-5'-phosphate glycosidase